MQMMSFSSSRRWSQEFHVKDTDFCRTWACIGVTASSVWMYKSKRKSRFKMECNMRLRSHLSLTWWSLIRRLWSSLIFEVRKSKRAAASALQAVLWLSALLIKLTWKHPDLLLCSSLRGRMIKVAHVSRAHFPKMCSRCTVFAYV